MFEDFLKLYIAISPLVFIIGARSVAVAKNFRRIPSAREILRVPNDIPTHELAWLGALKVFTSFWIGLFLFVFFKDIPLSTDQDKIFKGFFAITAVNIACGLNSLQSIKHYCSNVQGFPTKSDDNREYLKRFNAFPGFGGLLNSFISLGTALLMLCIIFAALL